MESECRKKGNGVSCLSPHTALLSGGQSDWLSSGSGLLGRGESNSVRLEVDGWMDGSYHFFRFIVGLACQDIQEEEEAEEEEETFRKR